MLAAPEKEHAVDAIEPSDFAVVEGRDCCVASGQQRKHEVGLSVCPSVGLFAACRTPGSVHLCWFCLHLFLSPCLFASSSLSRVCKIAIKALFCYRNRITGRKSPVLFFLFVGY